MYNFKKVYHRQHRETPVCLYNSPKSYANLRSESLINRLFTLGICVPYKRVSEITKDISHSFLRQFEIHKVFLPTSSRKNIFTVIAKDNIDLNASSSTASSHYHGTCMSLLQFPTTDNKGVTVDYDYVNCDKTKLKVDKLPNEYAVSERRNLSFPNEFYLTVSTVNTIDIQDGILINAINEEKHWLQSYTFENDCCSSFHASKHRCSIKLNDTSSIMPLIREKVHTLDTQIHCMKIIKETIKAINDGQTFVDVCDQPFYALTNKFNGNFLIYSTTILLYLEVYMLRSVCWLITDSILKEVGCQSC